MQVLRLRGCAASLGVTVAVGGGTLRDEAEIDEVADDGPGGGEDEAGGSALVDEEEQQEAGEGDEGEEDGGGVDEAGPDLAGVAAFVEVVDNGDEAVADLNDIVAVGVAVDEGVGGVAGSLEGDGDLIVLDAEVGDGSVKLVDGTKLL